MIKNKEKEKYKRTEREINVVYQKSLRLQFTE